MISFAKPGASVGRAGIVAAGAVALALSVGAMPASAASTLNDGNGAFTAAAAPTYEPFLGAGASEPCSVYTAYNANMTFTNRTVGSYTGPINVDVVSGPGVSWSENPQGTWIDASLAPGAADCPSLNTKNTQTISGFSFVLTGANASGGTLACRGTATYQRGFSSGTAGNNEQLNVKYVLTPPVGASCGGETAITINATIPSVTDRTDMLPFGDPSACASPIAPPACVLGPYPGLPK